MTRWTPWHLERQPELFVEIDPELAEMRGIKNGEKVIVENICGQVEAVAQAVGRGKTG